MPHRGERRSYKLYKKHATVGLTAFSWRPDRSLTTGCASSGYDLPPRAFDLLVSSRGTNSVMRFHGTTGDDIDDFVAGGAGGLATTQEVLLGPDGELYVTGRGTDAVLRFDASTGRFLGEFTTGRALSEPTKMSFGADGLLYVSQWGPRARRGARFDANTGAFVDEIAVGLREGMDHAWDAEGNLVVASFEDAKAYVYTSSGARSTLIGSRLKPREPVVRGRRSSVRHRLAPR